MFALPTRAQTPWEEYLSGADAHENGEGQHRYLFGDWGGERERLLGKGVKFDFHYIGDSLWNIDSQQNDRFASFDRFRGSIDLDFGKLVHVQGLTFHATAVWQGGGDLGGYLGLLSNPSSIAGTNTCRLDSWWLEQRLLKNHIAIRVGQFAGQDTYGDQVYGTSFVLEPVGGPLDNLSNDFESFDPSSTSALEVRVAPTSNFYLKSMVLSEDRTPYAHNQTGLVPQFRGVPVSVSEIGFTPGKKAISARTGDQAANRKGYSGVYSFGASYNPGKFVTPSGALRSGNYLLYWTANQAIWRANPEDSKGLDALFGYDWSPSGTNHQNTTLFAGARYNEPLPLSFHNTMSLSYVQNGLSSELGTVNSRTERGAEFNTSLTVLPMIILQPAIQYFANVAGGPHRAIVLGFRTKIEF